MKQRPRSRSQRGFTFVEAVIVVGVLGLIMLLGIPTLLQLLHRSRIEGIARETAVLMQTARFEAIKRGVQTVVHIDPNTEEVIAFTDVHGPTAADPSDGLFFAVPGFVNRATDYEIARLRLPAGVSFSFLATVGLASVDGFVNPGNPDPPDQQAIFLTDGTVLDEGAFRFGDQRGNFLEARVDPPTTARIEVRKWDDVAGAWHGFGEGGKPWTWK